MQSAIVIVFNPCTESKNNGEIEENGLVLFLGAGNINDLSQIKRSKSRGIV